MLPENKLASRIANELVSNRRLKISSFLQLPAAAYHLSAINGVLVIEENHRKVNCRN